LEAPRPRLATAQRTVLDERLSPIPVHPAAHGFVAGRSAIIGAARRKRIDAYSRASGIRCTRYTDDLTFSADPQLSSRSHSLLNAVDNIVRQKGSQLNPAKTRMRRRDQRQVVTGIVVKDHPHLARPEFDRLRAILHD
jgi:hypothetical protein